MRLDLFLKTSRLVKRRAVAAEMCNNARVLVDGRAAKPGKEVKKGDIITLHFSARTITVDVANTAQGTSGKTRPEEMYQVKSVHPPGSGMEILPPSRGTAGSQA